MTIVITRYFDSVDQAHAIREEMIRQRRFPRSIVDLYTDANGLAAALAAEKVEGETANAYQARMAGGGAVLLVRAGYKPLGVAQITREMTAKMGAADLGDVSEEFYYKDPIRPAVKVLEDHPLMMTMPGDPATSTYHMAEWPIPLISRRKPFTDSIFPRHARMADFPIPLIDRREPYTHSIFPRHARMADMFLPLISRRKPYTHSIFERHARMANFPLPLINRRKPYTGSLIPRHGRMATVPFPLLINGKTGVHALMPGAPRMANFPIPLLSNRKPYTGSIFGRHARMANFPIPLINRRVPFSDSAFPRHARMADMFLPLVIGRSDTANPNGGTGFSFSKLLRFPTISAR